MSLKDGGPAFPAKTVERLFTKEAMTEADLPDALAFAQADHAGMSVRDYVAAQALLGFIVSGATKTIPGTTQEAVLAELARGCYQVADAMLTERAKERP